MAPAPRAEWRRDLCALGLLAACVVLPGLGGHDLWNPDEPRYAQVAREMAASGDYLVPSFNDRLYTQKPPLMFWSMIACAALLGELDETAVRLPSALAAIGSALLIYALGRRLFDRRAAWIAAAIFLTNSKVLWQARIGQIDMLLTFLVLCAVCCWIEGRLDRRPAFSYLFFVFAGLATLAKGPVGLLPPLLSILAFLALARDRQGLRDLRVGRGLLLWAGIVLAWLGPAIFLAGREYMAEMLVGQNLTRYVAPSGHHKPFWYFLSVLPVDFLPWSLFVPAAIAGLRSLDGDRRRSAQMLLSWVVVTMIFFSLSPGKRTVYILTMYPGLALACGAGLAALEQARGRSRWWMASPALGLAVLLAIPALALTQQPAALRLDVPALFAPHARTLAIAVGAMAAAAAAAFLLALASRRTVGPVATLAVGIAASGVAVFVLVLPRLDSELSLRPLAAQLARELPPDHELAAFHEMEGGLLFYGSGFARELRVEQELRSYLAGGPRAWLVVDPDDLDKLSEPLDLAVVARQGQRDDGVRVLSTTAPASAPAAPPSLGE